MKKFFGVFFAGLLLLTCTSVPANAADKEECTTSAIIDLSDMAGNSNLSMSEPMTSLKWSSNRESQRIIL